jgi:uncharacterized protein YcbK (DUF882 family)
LGSRLKAVFGGAGLLFLAGVVGPSGMIAGSDQDRVISLYNIHSHETANILYKKDGKYVPSGLERANWMLRDWRKNETTSMDPALVDLLWEMHHELGSREPIHIISGYRSPSTNEMLRHTVGGQARHSRHILGKAADVQFPDVPLRNLRYAALIRERGGVGYYPTSAIPFVHVDTDRVRAWPRLPRYELALLFPQGRTQHQPADGGPLTRDDARSAREQHASLAAEITEFRKFRDQTKPVFALADAGGRMPSSGSPRIAALAPSDAEPKLIEPLRPAADARLAASGPTSLDRARLGELAALASLEPRLVSGPRLVSRRDSIGLSGPAIPDLAPAGRSSATPSGPRLAAIDPSAGSDRQLDANRSGWGNGWVAAPAYDEEHPEELSYRPFPIAPLLTASPQEPILSELRHHDVARTLDMLDQPGTVLPLRFRPGEQLAQLMWAQQFRGDPVGLAKLFEAQGEAAQAPGLKDRSVRTTAR